MIRSLLVTRFGLETRVESAPTDVYVLVVGKAGTRMQEVEASNELEKELVPDPGMKFAPRDRTAETLGGRTRRITSSAGIWTIESKESQPSRELADFTGTPITGMVVIAATIPGRCAAPPAPAIITFNPRVSAVEA